MRPRVRFRRIVSLSGLIALVLMLVITFTPLTRVWARTLAGDWTDAEGDTLVVLSGEIEDDGVLGLGSYMRTLYAVRAWRAAAPPFHRIIVAGGRPPGAPASMGEAMRDFLVSYGVPREKIIVEGRSLHTSENAWYVKSLLGPLPGRIVLMTSDFHMFRARRVFERAGVHVVPRPIPDLLKHYNHVSERWYCFCSLVAESGKIVFYAWNRWL